MLTWKKSREIAEGARKFGGGYLVIESVPPHDWGMANTHEGATSLGLKDPLMWHLPRVFNKRDWLAEEIYWLLGEGSNDE